MLISISKTTTMKFNSPFQDPILKGFSNIDPNIDFYYSLNSIIKKIDGIKAKNVNF